MKYYNFNVHTIQIKIIKMSKNVLNKIPYTLLINILYLISIFFILISIDNCIWFSYKLNKTITPQQNDVNYYKKEFDIFIKIINKIINNLKINGSLNFICIKSNIDIDNLYNLYQNKFSKELQNKIEYEQENEIEHDMENKLENIILNKVLTDKQSTNFKINDKQELINKNINKNNINLDHCFYINKNIQNNIRKLLLQKLDESYVKKENDINQLKNNKYKKDISKKNNEYTSIAKENINLFFDKNKDTFGKISMLINITNYIKTAFKLSVLFIGTKLLLSIFTSKKWLSLIIIPFLLITGYVVFYFIKDNKNIGIPEGIFIEGVGITNMLIGSIFFYVSLLLNLVF